MPNLAKELWSLCEFCKGEGRSSCISCLGKKFVRVGLTMDQVTTLVGDHMAAQGDPAALPARKVCRFCTKRLVAGNGGLQEGGAGVVPPDGGVGWYGLAGRPPLPAGSIQSYVCPTCYERLRPV